MHLDENFEYIRGMIVALIQPAFTAPDETHKYPAGDGSDLSVHAFLPITTRSGKAAIFYFGGGWRVGSPEQFFPFVWPLKLADSVFRTLTIACRAGRNRSDRRTE